MSKAPWDLAHLLTHSFIPSFIHSFIKYVSSTKSWAGERETVKGATHKHIIAPDVKWHKEPRGMRRCGGLLGERTPELRPA